MATFACGLALLLLHLTLAKASRPDVVNEYSIVITDVQPLKRDAYLCRSFRVPNLEGRHSWIVDVQSDSVHGKPHHLDLFTCVLPGYMSDQPSMQYSEDLIWDCGVDVESGIPNIVKAARCSDPHDFVVPFEWNRHETPDRFQVGIKVGPDAPFKFLVVEAHYMDVPSVNRSTKTGFTVQILSSDERTRLKDAAMMILGSVAGSAPANSISSFDSACNYEGREVLNAILYRTHSHSLGQVASGFKISKDGGWQLLGKQFPQDRGHYYPLTGATGEPEEGLVVRIQPGDTLAARCFVNNTRPFDVAIGERHADEMCYFYLIYFVDTNHSIPFPFRSCYTSDPAYRWNQDPRLALVYRDIDLMSRELDGVHHM